jgi:type II secretory pathway pseudopilin PulG
LRTSGARGRFLREEGGFTLTEMMITTIVMIVVLMALYSIFDMSMRISSFTNNKVEAVASARAGLEKMEREIRAAYPVTTNSSTLFFNANGVATSNPPQQMPTSNPPQITFGNDLGAPEGEAGTVADGVITCGSPCEYITYKLTDAAGNTPCNTAPCTLRRVNALDSAVVGDPVVENVAAGGLTLAYLQSDGTTATSEGQISRVRITLNVRVNRGIYGPATQTLTTVVDLRNRL